MAAFQQVFRRYEKKYRMNTQQMEAFVQALAAYMEPDAYGRYTICNLYYDTDDYRLIRASLDKPVYKEKLRLRSYGTPGEDDRVFLELKKKYKGVVYKRRIALTPRQLTEYYENGGDPPTSDPQILREIDWFMSLYRPQPKTFIAYDREAYFGKDNPDLRVTVDRNIRYRDTDLDLTLGDYGRVILPPDDYLIEIKIPGTMPLWLAHLLAELQVFPTSFSKYGFCYTHYLLKNKNAEDLLYA